MPSCKWICANAKTDFLNLIYKYILNYLYKYFTNWLYILELLPLPILEQCQIAENENIPLEILYNRFLNNLTGHFKLCWARNEKRISINNSINLSRQIRQVYLTIRTFDNYNQHHHPSLWNMVIKYQMLCTIQAKNIYIPHLFAENS